MIRDWQWVVCDLDGTLADDEHRKQYAEAKDWASFHSALTTSAPIEATGRLISALHLHYRIMLLTGTMSTWSVEVGDWLNRYGYNRVIDKVLMRPEDDYRPTEVIKLELLEKHFKTKKEVLKSVLFALDDHPRVITAFREYGITVHAVR